MQTLKIEKNSGDGIMGATNNFKKIKNDPPSLPPVDLMNLLNDG